MFDDVTRLVAHERRCCPSRTFARALAPDHGPRWLRLIGSAGTLAFLDVAALPAADPAARA